MASAFRMMGLGVGHDRRVMQVDIRWKGLFPLNSMALTRAYHSSYGLMIHWTPSLANFVLLLGERLIFAVVSGVLLMQTKIFMARILKVRNLMNCPWGQVMSVLTDKLPEAALGCGPPEAAYKVVYATKQR
jgi:hypothetical protein